MNPRNIDPLGIAIGNALNALAAARESQDLVTEFSRIGSQLADVGRQQADNSQIREVVRRCAGEADISGPVGNEWWLPFTAEAGWREIAETVALKSIAQLHEDGLKANEQDVKAAAAAEIDRIRIAPETRRLVEQARKDRVGAPPKDLFSFIRFIQTKHSDRPDTPGPGM